MVSTANVDVLTIALASAPVPSPLITTLGDISNLDVVSILVENDDGINTLLDDYQTQYNQETGFDDLKKVMDNIYFVLETKRYDPGIAVALNQVAISFPDKTPIKPVGKLYRRFRNKIFNKLKCN